MASLKEEVQRLRQILTDRCALRLAAQLVNLHHRVRWHVNREICMPALNAGRNADVALQDACAVHQLCSASHQTLRKACAALFPPYSEGTAEALTEEQAKKFKALLKAKLADPSKLAGFVQTAKTFQGSRRGEATRLCWSVPRRESGWAGKAGAEISLPWGGSCKCLGTTMLRQ